MAVLIGTSGNDTIEGTFRADDINGKAGDDVLIGLARADEIKGGTGNDGIDGGLGNDLVRGGFGNDLLFGWLGNDLLAGGFGDDTLDGGPGSDVMRGGFGSDTFVLRAFGPPAAAVAATTYPEEPEHPGPLLPNGDRDVVVDFDWQEDSIAVQPGRIANIVVGDFDGDGGLDATLILDTGDRTIFLNATEQQVAAAIVDADAVV